MQTEQLSVHFNGLFSLSVAEKPYEMRSWNTEVLPPHSTPKDGTQAQGSYGSPSVSVLNAYALHVFL